MPPNNESYYELLRKLAVFRAELIAYSIDNETKLKCLQDCGNIELKLVAATKPVDSKGR